MKIMTKEQKLTYLNVACRVAGFPFTDEALEILEGIYSLVIEKKGDTSIEEIIKIECDVKKNEENKKRSELLDKVSEKVPS